jgi:pSer/pThr/pTyr-binding forkhead associated (FHA) protein/outer membrane biosynthesis protein TonB
VQQDIGKNKQLFQIIPKQALRGFKVKNLRLGRYLVGRTEGCDVVIPHKDVSSVHAVLEVTPRGITIYDMNSKNGTFINGAKVIAQDVPLGGTIKLGTVELKLREYVADDELPPVLSNLDPQRGGASPLNTVAPPQVPTPTQKEKPKQVQKELPKAQPPMVEEEVPYIVYPLSSDPNSDYSEYIFEDSDELYPIFKYELNKQAIEVMILFKDKVYSVDYLPEKDGVYQIAGLTNKDKEIEFPYLGKEEKVPFVEITKGNCLVHQLHNYELLHLMGKKVITENTGTVNIQDNDIVKLQNDQLEIYVRRIPSPPIVKKAPFFRRDKDLRKYLFMMILLVLLPIVLLNVIEVDKEKDDEKDPERIATILYKQKMIINKNKTVEQSKKKPVKKQTAPKKQVVKKSQPKKTQATSKKTTKKVTKKTDNPGAKKATKVQKVKRAKNPAPKKNNNSKVANTASAAKKSSRRTKTRRSNVKSKSMGRVDTYKSMNFKSTISPSLAKGGTLRGARTARTSSDSISNAQVSGGVATNLKKAAVGTEVGSLSGSTVGKLGESKGTKGLSAKTGVYTAGIPSETVVLGSMDPDVIRRILRDNIPFFRSCYQKELDRNAGADVSGTIRLVFTIGASGHVSRAGIDGRTALPVKVKRCVIGVLRGIQFPRPMGGGTVDVKQPFNFYPKRL